MSQVDAKPVLGGRAASTKTPFCCPDICSLNQSVVILYSFCNFWKCCFVTDFVVKGLVWDGMGFAVGMMSPPL